MAIEWKALAGYRYSFGGGNESFRSMEQEENMAEKLEPLSISNWRSWCPQCGPSVELLQEDGCCVHCGATCTGPGAELALELIRKSHGTNDELSELQEFDQPKSVPAPWNVFGAPFAVYREKFLTMTRRHSIEWCEWLLELLYKMSDALFEEIVERRQRLVGLAKERDERLGR
jgi:hypothetical protein